MHGHPTNTSTGARGRARRPLGALLPVAGLLAGGFVLMTDTPVQAAEITVFPERLYMAPEGTTLLAELVGVPVGALSFDGGTDIISQDVRSLVVDTVDGDAGCELIDEAVGVPDYDIDDCSRVQLDVGHGRLHLGGITTELRDHLADPDGAGPLVAGSPNPNDPVYFLPSGATIDSEYQTADGSLSIGINGRPDQLNAALADLVYTPDAGYWYVGSNPENLNMIVVPGNSDDVGVPLEERESDSLTVQIRVLDVNDFPTHTGPATKTADAQLPLVISNEYTVGDEDNDEIIDDNDAGDPPPLPDGEDSDMLLIGWLTCGQPIAPNTGFHFGSAVFQSNDLTIQDLLDTFFPVSENPDNQLIQDAILAGLDAIDPAIKDVEWATSDPTTPTTAFAGVSSIDEIQDALAQVTFLHNAPNDTCELVTVVSDLGNNGLPLQYVGTPFPADPLNDPFGIEIPFLGFDFNLLEITTGDLTEIDVTFTTPTIVVDEGAAPVTAIAQIRVSPANHPEFQIRWDAVPGSALASPDPDADYAGTSNNTLTIGENVEFIPIDLVNVLGSEFPIQTNVFADTDVEGPETFTFEIIPGAFSPPAGFTITSSVDTATVTIVDDDDPANTVAVGDASVVEGDAGTTTLNIPVTLSGPADGDESVTVETAEFPAGPTSATSGVDFQPASVTVDFALGETQRLVPITVNGDTTPENNEQFAVNITNSNVTPTDAAAVGTITDDDGVEPQASINDVTANEGNSGTTNFTFTITLDAPAAGGETIQWSTQDGAATAPSDYTAVPPTTITFAPGQQQQTVTVVVIGDTGVEPSEAFFVNLGNPVGLVTGPPQNQGQGTIVNDDSNPNVSIASVTQDEGDAGTSTMTFTLTLDRPALGGETVDVNDTPVSASEPGDYTFASPETVTFSPGDTTATVAVTINGDTTTEADETFTMTLSNASSGLILAGGPATGTITDDDTEVPSVVSIADGSITEGASAVTTISMTNPAGRTCSVSVTSTNGSAEAPGDFNAFQGGTFNLVNLASDVLSLSAVDDDLVEGSETYTLTIALLPASNVNCVLGDAVATVTITSDDVASVVSIADGTVAEGAIATTTISMTSSANRTCSVSVTSTNGSAVAPGDYNPFSGGTFNLVDLPSDTLGISANDDAAVEGTESFTLTIALLPSSDGQCTLGDSTATILIVDTDSPVDSTPPTVTIDQSAAQVDPTSVSPILFRVDFSEPVVGFQTGDVLLSGTALPTTALVTPVSGSVYSVSVSGMSQSGTVIASLGAGVAVDAANNPSAASTSTDNTVTFTLPPVDVTPPSVTIDQSAAQVDPTSVSPILFRVDFSEPVTGFVTGDVLLSGTALPTTAVVTPVSSSVYSVSVSGMSQSGTVIASLGAGVAVDAASNPSLASTSTDNSVQFDILQAPLTLNLPPNQTANNDPGQAGAIVNYPTVTASGGVPPVVVDCMPISGAFFPLGTSTVSCTAADAEEQFLDEEVVDEAIVFGTFTITVVDNEPPTIADNPDLTRETVANAPVTVTFPLPAASDNSGAAPTVVCVPSSGATFGIGTSTVTCTATDGAGNTASSSFTVTVTSTGSGVPGPTTPTFTTVPPTTNPIRGLPATGSDPQVLALVALALLAGGAAIVLGSRRRTN